MICVLLPVFNEQESLERLLLNIQRIMEAQRVAYRILVIDDGSTDSTPGILKEYADQVPIEVLTHRMNRGLGETVRDGFERAAEICAPDDIIIRMDGDATHEPEYIPLMVEKVKEGFEVVIASRFQRGGGARGVTAYRTVVSRCANLVLKVLFPISGVREYTCGFRAYRASLIQDAIRVFGNYFIDLKGLGFTCTAEKLIKLRLMRPRISEVPFVLRYDQKKGPSKMLSSITTLGYLVLIVKNIYPWGPVAKGWRREIRRLRQEERDG